MLLRRGALTEAERHARDAIRIAPDEAQAHRLMGMVMTEAGRAPVGEYHYRQALALAGEEATTLANLAWNLKLQGRISEARTLYERSAVLAAAVPKTLLGWARLEEAAGNLPRALELADQAESLALADPLAARVRAAILARLGSVEAALSCLDAIGNPGPLELLEKGRLLDRLGRHNEAFAAFNAGKRHALALGAPSYQAEAARDQALRLKYFFTLPRFAALPRATRREGLAQPVFITGFPRSGTTLIEQSLSLHPRIAAGDELPFIGDLTASLPRLLGSPLLYPEALAELWMGDKREGLGLLRDLYLAWARQWGIPREGAAWFTDKMPLNETHLGLIHLVFPESPVIHMLRHPLDAVLSAYSHHLTHGYCCAATLESLARHYVLTADLAAHYLEAAKPRCLLVRYEDVVDDQEREMRRILDFIGAEFDPACLHFERNLRPARTPSQTQVTEPLHRRSRHRYRHYLRQLAPVIPILEPVMRRLGYSISE